MFNYILSQEHFHIITSDIPVVNTHYKLVGMPQSIYTDVWRNQSAMMVSEVHNKYTRSLALAANVTTAMHFDLAVDNGGGVPRYTII